MYLVKTPWWLKKIYPQLIWQMPSTEKVLYLTFDDGPHITATPFVLQMLHHYNAKASFFCIGKNVLAYPSIYQQIIDQGHTVGNHTNNHVNGFKTSTQHYIENIQLASEHINSHLFRPPYGRITKAQIKALLNTPTGIEKIIMWSVLSGDFDTTLSGEKCLQHVLTNCSNGSIIVFHDSSKAWDRMHVALPKVLEHFTHLGYSFKAL
jgi:peptidoglycan-N-acetylglucosamine deacetylase